MTDLYRNVGGPHRRANDERVAHGVVFQPTEAELKAFPDKFEFVRSATSGGTPPPREVESPDSDEVPDSDEDATRNAPEDPEAATVDQFATGGGWFQLPDGRKVQGRKAAIAALSEPLG
jgi:hypothetical protein